MDKETRQALEKSIGKWRRIVDETGFDSGTENCALCKKFYLCGCDGCPVAEKTGRSDCDGSPYGEWGEAFEVYEWHIIRKRYADTDKKRAAAQAMLDFLISLRPSKAGKGRGK